MPADIGRGVVEVLRRHRKRHVQRLREMLLVEQAGLSGPLHPQPVVDRHDDEPLAGVVVEEGPETPVVPRAGHEAAAEKEHQAGFRPAVGREGRVTVQPQRVSIPHGIDEGLFFDLPRRRAVVLRSGRRPQEQCSDQKQTSHATASLRRRTGSPGSGWR